MNDYVKHINWKEKSEDLKLGLFEDQLTEIVRLDPGMEADVYRIRMSQSTFVLKIWNRQSKPNISIQYQILYSLYAKGVSVSKPYGWGIDRDNNSVLLTSDAGTQIRKLDKAILMKLANQLMDIHASDLDSFSTTSIPSYDFIHYFFPHIDNHSDLQELLIQLLDQSNMDQTSLIHGDYNLSNILESNKKYTIIDWTNVQLGDPRYDIAWSTILIWIYVGERYYTVYRNIFCLNTQKTN